MKKQLVPKLRFPEFEGEWEEKRLGNIAKFSKGKGISKSDIIENGNNECIRYGELYTTYAEVIIDVKSRTNTPKTISVLSEANDVIIPSSGESQIDIATASCVSKSGVILGSDLNIIKSKINGVFLSYLLNNSKKKDIAKLSQGISVVHLYNKQLASLKLNISSQPEQQKIANFLTAIDSQIQTLEKKKSLLEQYKKGVMQQIFPSAGSGKVPKLRFKPENGEEFPEWEVKKLGGYLKHKSIRNKNLEVTRTLSVSNSKGFILQSEQFDNHRVASKDVSNYKVVERNDIAYNPSRINVGSIATLKDFKIGIVSPMYVVFSLKDNLDLSFFENIITTHLFKHLVKVGCSGSVRDSLNFDDLENFTLKIPSLKEQTKIANFLSAIDNNIVLVNTKIEHTKTYKKGLLQQMFV